MLEEFVINWRSKHLCEFFGSYQMFVFLHSCFTYTAYTDLATVLHKLIIKTILISDKPREYPGVDIASRRSSKPSIKRDFNLKYI